jgi:proteic killer suppression protein
MRETPLPSLFLAGKDLLSDPRSHLSMIRRRDTARAAPAFPENGAGHPAQAEAASYRNAIYNIPVIKSFKCGDTEALHQRRRVARWVNIEAVARRKLDQLDAACELRDMAPPPGNRLEALSGNRKGQHSIRINDQFRVCFVWTPQGPKDVEIVDYH